ncbi:TBC1 domain family member [Trichinella pseudospiralis]|uniref:Uncharacterized protein n=1 Tax=Trichinella pseudospiralis TaxID=6337 RepID=A0A0V1FWF5_TRIPS|nr:hypothetical protein T4D_16471 [Trichinella pseudospiralis]
MNNLAYFIITVAIITVRVDYSIAISTTSAVQSDISKEDLTEQLANRRNQFPENFNKLFYSTYGGFFGPFSIAGYDTFDLFLPHYTNYWQTGGYPYINWWL